MTMAVDDIRWGSDVVEEEEVLGDPCLTFTPCPNGVPELLVDAHRFPDRDYLVQGERRMTFAEHEQAISAVAALLAARGVGAGDRVGTPTGA
jgi:long-chain acyl-CoA synthetase